ncbi:metallophosphoesterase family protein [Streptomyces sp. NPDC048434]|uniref:metallophosphoesterase family protein n=1 Tax=Streptomyces sp. NPDC048434 TaxID=3365549 RepID=UPI0037110497
MLNRVAVLSDIHGVLPAVEAVLAEPEVSAADRIVLTGDITAGPQPAQVLDLLTGPDRWKEVLSGLDADVRTVVCGHTHMPFVRLVHGRLVINPGSVGMPYGRSGAHWAVLGPGVELRSTDFDIEAAVTQVSEDSSYPEIAEWADYFLHARATDADALEAFGPRDGREQSG